MSNPYSAPTTESELAEESSEPMHPVAGPPLEPLKIPKGEDLVTVYTTSDAVEAEMLTQVLLAEGIPTPVFTRMTGAQAGIGTMAAPQLIRVPRSRQDEAQELIEQLLKEQQSNARIEDEEYEPPVLSRRRELAKKGLAVFILGPTLLLLAIGLIGAIASWFH